MCSSRDNSELVIREQTFTLERDGQPQVLPCKITMNLGRSPEICITASQINPEEEIGSNARDFEKKYVIHISQHTPPVPLLLIGALAGLEAQKQKLNNRLPRCVPSCIVSASESRRFCILLKRRA